ncbi:hypothetical protein BC941DRAFT_199420 [Chlamydoabsidia padenii]|nr:hypothetical protein BC941DRAFT_199420 [Chlamydoabsidia padenii]
MMGANSLCIKAKWVTLKSWLIPSSLVLLHRQKRQRQKEQKQLYHKQRNEMVQQQRRSSQCTTCSSRPSSEEDRQAHSFFKRRSSQSSHMSLADFNREAEKLYDLFLLAMDELNYAGDSQGTFYYTNDRVSAQEAIENFSNASTQLLNTTHNTQLKSQLQAMVQPRLCLLQTQFGALPEPDDPLTYRRPIYCS